MKQAMCEVLGREAQFVWEYTCAGRGQINTKQHGDRTTSEKHLAHTKSQ